MASPPDQTDFRLQKLRQVCQANEIRTDFAAKLRQLEGYDIVVLVDDSGSMNTPATAAAGGGGDAFARQVTRWTEVQQFANRVVELATCLDPDGIDLRFLNRPGFSNVASMAQVAQAFSAPPSGLTPLAFAVSSILRDKAAVIIEKKLLLVIATDGQPTDSQGKVNIAEFTSVLSQRSQKVSVAIVACTDDEASVGYLNHLDKTCPGVDVCDDFLSERREVLAARGSGYAFSYGDYVVKVCGLY